MGEFKATVARFRNLEMSFRRFAKGLSRQLREFRLLAEERMRDKAELVQATAAKEIERLHRSTMQLLLQLSDQLKDLVQNTQKIMGLDAVMPDIMVRAQEFHAFFRDEADRYAKSARKRLDGIVSFWKSSWALLWTTLAISASFTFIYGCYISLCWEHRLEAHAAWDESYTRGLLAFHPHAEKFDRTVLEKITHPPTRAVWRFVFFCSNLKLTACCVTFIWILVHLSGAIAILALVFITALYTIADIGVVACNDKRIVFLNNICTSTFDRTCEASHLLLCSDLIQPLSHLLRVACTATFVAVIPTFLQWSALELQLHSSFQQAVHGLIWHTHRYSVMDIVNEGRSPEWRPSGRDVQDGL